MYVYYIYIHTYTHTCLIISYMNAISPDSCLAMYDAHLLGGATCLTLLV